MSRDAALAAARDLRGHLLDAGVPQVSIEVMEGRPGPPSRWITRGKFAGTSFVANLGHHIVSRPSASNPTPGLALIKLGRTGVPGPLANGYGGMDLVARVICMGLANHPGEGGPWTVDGYTIPRDGGRPYLFGWEHEGGLSEAVWDATYTNSATGKRMTYRSFMGRCHAGTLRWLARPRTAHGEHRTWADLKQIGRKIDRLGYTRGEGIVELTPYYLGTVEDDMTPEEHNLLVAAESLSRSAAAALHRLENDPTSVVRKELTAIRAAVAAADVNDSPEALAAELAPLLIPHLPTVVVDLDDAALGEIAVAVADEQSRRLQA